MARAAKKGLTAKERNSPDNLILLCPTHHTIVDEQHRVLSGHHAA